MDWIDDALLALAAGLALVLAWRVLDAALRALRLRLRRSRVVIVPPGRIPAPERQRLEASAPLLRELGFRPRCSTAVEPLVEAPRAQPLHFEVLEHADGHTHAWVTPSAGLAPGEPCTAAFVTLLTDGHVLATVNCWRHALFAPPAGWTIHDDYLPDLRQAWTRHAARVAEYRGRVVTDALEVFRACQRATEQFGSDCEHRGLARRSGEHWRPHWRAALRFAWQRWWGGRKAARARRAAARQAAAGAR